MPKLAVGSPWKRFRDKWQECARCELCYVRKRTVLCRGKIPADVLFIGEAPGASEDATGLPFIGPAGKLLDSQVAEALNNCPGKELRLCFTNLVCCIPKEEGKKIGEPMKSHIQACEERLQHFLKICKPRLIVSVGDLADKWFSSFYPELEQVKITHPAAILRAEVVRQSLMRQKVVVILENAFTEL